MVTLKIAPPFCPNKEVVDNAWINTTLRCVYSDLQTMFWNLAKIRNTYVHSGVRYTMTTYNANTGVNNRPINRLHARQLTTLSNAINPWLYSLPKIISLYVCPTTFLSGYTFFAVCLSRFLWTFFLHVLSTINFRLWSRYCYQSLGIAYYWQNYQ